jgi:hypothetical protein
MGSSKKVTVSYWYKLVAHFGFAKGPVDAMLEWRGGDRVIWKGVQETSGIISVNKPDLYGGESAEGGVVGDFELLMGEQTQMPSSYLAGIFGALQSANRGKLTGILRGAKIGAGNPYPKAMSWKFRRILKGWDDDVCWYPEKAAITLSGTPGDDSLYIGQNGGANGGASVPSLQEYDNSFFVFDWGDFDGHPFLLFVTLPLPETYEDSTYPRRHIFSVDGAPVWDSGWYGLPADQSALDALLFALGRSDLIGPIFDGLPSQTYDRGTSEPAVTTKCYVAMIDDARPNTFTCTAELRTAGTLSNELIGINPAHILYDSITSRKENGGMGEPVGRINEASFEAAADQAYSEGFGLCTTWRGGESAEQFQQRICNVVGWNVSQDVLDGEYYIDMLRGDYILDDLPIITDDDIYEFRAEANDLTGAINHLSVAWYDPEKVESRVTTPVQSLGAIESAGGVIPEVREYYEIPYEPLALRVADRDLRAGASPYWRFQILANRRALSLRRPGRYFRLMAPKRGFADMVCIVSEINFGNFANGAIQISAMQDVISLADAVFVTPQDSLDDPPNGGAIASPETIAIESPYVELASALSSADRDALTEDSAYLQVGAVRPAGSINYGLATAISGNPFEVSGNADWTPSALLAASPLFDVPETVIAYTNGVQLENVVLGTWALWGDEIVRVDAIDTDADTMTLARGCGDTTPKDHADGERIWFIGDWYGTDNKEYATGEEIQAKALTRTGADQLAEASAPTVLVEMDSRQARPYPPGKLRITDAVDTDAAYPASAQGELTVTWAHRDRLLQADQLVPEGDSDVGPEDGTVYNLRYYLDDVFEAEELGIVGTSGTPFTLGGDGVARVEVESERDGLLSWQAAVAEFNYVVEPHDTRIVVGGNRRIVVGGNTRATKD